MGISPRIRWGSIFPGREWGTGALLITIPFLCNGPHLTYKVRSRITVICNSFMATLFQTCLLTDDTIHQQFYKLIITILVGKEKGRLFEKKSGGRRAVFQVFSRDSRFLRSVAWRHEERQRKGQGCPRQQTKTQGISSIHFPKNQKKKKTVKPESENNT